MLFRTREENQNSLSEKRIVIIISVIGSFLTPFIGSSINITLPAIGKDFGVSTAMLGWIATSFLLSSSITLLPAGRLADIYGRKIFYTIGMFIFSLSSLLCSFAPDSASLIVFRVIQGVGGSMIFGTGVALLSSVFSPGERGKALGINVSAVYLGGSLGPFVGGIITKNFGWRSVFIINAIIGGFVVFLILWKLKKEWGGIKGEKFDFSGSIIYAVSIISIVLGLTSIKSYSGDLLLASGLAGIILFILHEKGRKFPLFSVELIFRNRIFAFSNLAALINYSATFGVGFLMSLYLQQVKGLNPQEAGIVMVSQPVVMALVSPVAGNLSDRLEPRLIASTGMGVTSLGLFMFSFLNKESSILYIIIAQIILGLGLGMFSSPNTNAVMGSVGKNVYSVASAILATMRIWGQMLSMVIVTAFFSSPAVKIKISTINIENFIHNMRLAFVIFTLMCFAGIFASIARGNASRAEELGH